MSHLSSFISTPHPLPSTPIQQPPSSCFLLPLRNSTSTCTLIASTSFLRRFHTHRNHHPHQHRLVPFQASLDEFGDDDVARGGKTAAPSRDTGRAREEFSRGGGGRGGGRGRGGGGGGRAAAGPGGGTGTRSRGAFSEDDEFGEAEGITTRDRNSAAKTRGGFRNEHYSSRPRTGSRGGPGYAVGGGGGDAGGDSEWVDRRKILQERGHLLFNDEDPEPRDYRPARVIPWRKQGVVYEDSEDEEEREMIARKIRAHEERGLIGDAPYFGSKKDRKKLRAITDDNMSLIQKAKKIQACATKKEWQLAIQIYQQIDKPDTYMSNLTIAACAKSGAWKPALQIYKSMKKNKIERDKQTYINCIEACGKGKMWEKSIYLVKKMEAAGLVPDTDVYAAAMTACDWSGQWQQCEQLIAEMQDQRALEPTTAIYNTMIAAYGKNDQYQKAIKLFRYCLESRHIRTDEHTYAAAIMSAEKAGEYEHALKMYRRMIKKQYKPNAFIVITIVRSCIAAGDYRRAMELFTAMDSRNFKVQPFHYEVVMGAVAKSGAVKKGFKYIAEMKLKKLRPTTKIYSELIIACCRKDNYDLAIQTMEQDMRNDRVWATSDFYKDIIRSLDDKDPEANQDLAKFLDLMQMKLVKEEAKQKQRDRDTNRDHDRDRDRNRYASRSSTSRFSS